MCNQLKVVKHTKKSLRAIYFEILWKLVCVYKKILVLVKFLRVLSLQKKLFFCRAGRVWSVRVSESKISANLTIVIFLFFLHFGVKSLFKNTLWYHSFEISLAGKREKKNYNLKNQEKDRRRSECETCDDSKSERHTWRNLVLPLLLFNFKC